jgi:hypothetical protein
VPIKLAIGYERNGNNNRLFGSGNFPEIALRINY